MRAPWESSASIQKLTGSGTDKGIAGHESEPEYSASLDVEVVENKQWKVRRDGANPGQAFNFCHTDDNFLAAILNSRQSLKPPTDSLLLFLLSAVL
jgi:hypothetical protein